MEWLNWSNFAYLVAIMIGGCITFAATKYRKILKEIQEALNTYHEAAKDGKITEEERNHIVKEVLDIAQAGVKIFWRW
tara:strand:+ start:339 stop:572 length:234 start_codon:yes stop_codon:yes gene_type:complete